MRRGEVSATAGIEQILDSVEVEKERVTAGTGEKCIVAGLDDIRPSAERYLRVDDNLRADRVDRVGLRAFCDEDAYGLFAVLRRREHVGESDVGQAIAVAVDVKPIDGVGVQRVCVRVGIEDQHRPRRIRRRLESVEIAKIEPLVAQGWAEAQSGKMVRHFCLLRKNRTV